MQVQARFGSAYFLAGSDKRQAEKAYEAISNIPGFQNHYISSLVPPTPFGFDVPDAQDARVEKILADAGYVSTGTHTSPFGGDPVHYYKPSFDTQA